MKPMRFAIIARLELYRNTAIPVNKYEADSVIVTVFLNALKLLINKIMIVKQVINELSEELGEIPMDTIIQTCADRGVDQLKCDEVLNSMKKSGELFEPRHDVFRKTQ